MSVANKLEHTTEISDAAEDNRMAVARSKEWANLCRAAAKGRPGMAYRPPNASFTRDGETHKITARRSQWCQALLKLQGERYRLNRWHRTEGLESVYEDDAKRAWELREVDPEESRKIVEQLESFGKAERREYVYPVLDTSLNKALLMCGRQVEKCCNINNLALLQDGSTRRIEDVQVGDVVVGLAEDGAHTEAGTVTWKSEELLKPCVRLTTRQGHATVVALSHPMRAWGDWAEAESFAVGDKLAAVRQGGIFTGGASIPDYEVGLLAYMIAEGYTPHGVCQFSQDETGPVLDDFKKLATSIGDDWSSSERSPGNWNLRFSAYSALMALIKAHGLDGQLSGDRFVPDFVYGLDRRQTALFLNRLWAGDGHCSLQDSSYHLEYDSISERLCRDVQRLLHKFGIPTSFRRWKPTLYEGTENWAYKLRVETAEGVRRFLTEVGALGKSEGLPLPEEDDEEGTG